MVSDQAAFWARYSFFLRSIVLLLIFDRSLPSSGDELDFLSEAGPDQNRTKPDQDIHHSVISRGLRHQKRSRKSGTPGEGEGRAANRVRRPSIRTPIARFAHARHSLIARVSPSGSKPDTREVEGFLPVLLVGLLQPRFAPLCQVPSAQKHLRPPNAPIPLLPKSTLLAGAALGCV